jgi:hypothetical protein
MSDTPFCAACFEVELQECREIDRRQVELLRAELAQRRSVESRIKKTG